MRTFERERETCVRRGIDGRRSECAGVVASRTASLTRRIRCQIFPTVRITMTALTRSLREMERDVSRSERARRRQRGQEFAIRGVAARTIGRRVSARERKPQRRVFTHPERAGLPSRRRVTGNARRSGSARHQLRAMHLRAVTRLATPGRGSHHHVPHTAGIDGSGVTAHTRHSRMLAHQRESGLRVTRDAEGRRRESSDAVARRAVGRDTGNRRLTVVIVAVT